MKENEKRLLLMDLAARLPYGVKVLHDEKTKDLRDISFDGSVWLGQEKFDNDIEEVKPYLRPMSSMTMEEKAELCARAYAPDEMKTLEEKLYVIRINAKNAADFFNEHHIDFRNLIERGLAIDCTNLNIY